MRVRVRDQEHTRGLYVHIGSVGNELGEVVGTRLERASGVGDLISDGEPLEALEQGHDESELRLTRGSQANKRETGAKRLRRQPRPRLGAEVREPNKGRKPRKKEEEGAGTNCPEGGRDWTDPVLSRSQSIAEAASLGS